MNIYREPVKLVLAFAVGVSLSAGYVAVGQLDGHGAEVVVVQERCPADPSESSETLADSHRIELAPLAGDVLIPEGMNLWIGLDGLWLRGTNEGPLLRLDDGRLAAGDVEGGQVPALREILATTHGQRQAVLWVDHRLPGATISAVIATLQRGGIDDYALAVAGVEGQPRAYRFAPALRSGTEGGKDASLELSLRLSDEGSVAAWVRPLADGLPQLGGPVAQPLDLGPAAASSAASCVLAEAGPPDAETLAPLGAKLCALGQGHEQGRLSVEYGLANTRTLGELLTLRASLADSESCRLRSTIAPPAVGEPSDCTAALGATEMMSYLDERSTNTMKSEVQGLLSKDLVRSVVRANIGDIRTCYNMGLTEDDSLEGRVVVDFVIGEDGTVESSELGEHTTLEQAEVESCIVDAIARWSFPAPAKGKVKVSYPFVLSLG